MSVHITPPIGGTGVFSGDAGDVPFTPVGTIAATDVQTAIAEVATEAGAGVTDGDKGDITVSGGGATWTIDNDAVTYAKIQNVSATDKVLGRSTAGAGTVEEIACTSAGRSMIGAASAAAQTALLSAVVGDSGSGGTKGLVPAPGTGDAAAGKFLKASGVWDVPSGSGSGDVVGPASATDNAVVRFDTTTGKLVQNSVVTIADSSGNVAGVGNLTSTSITVNGASDAVEVAIRANAGQTADVFQVQNSSATPLFKVSAGGGVDIPTGQTYKINGTALASTDLSDVSVVTGADDDFLQRKSGAWTNRTIAQVKTDLAASTSTAGVVELAIDSEVTTGTSTSLAVTPDALAGSTVFGRKALIVEVFAATTNCATGDGKKYFSIPSALNGMNLVRVYGRAITAGTTGTMDVQLHNVTDAADILSTKLTWDSTEAGTDTAATAVVINSAADDVATNDLIRVDVDAVQTTPAQGMILVLEYQLP